MARVETRVIACWLLGCVVACAGEPHVRVVRDTERAEHCEATSASLSQARSIASKYCVSCHSANGAAGADYDFTTERALFAERRNIQAKLALHTMPPPGAAQLTPAELRSLWCWASSSPR